MPVSFLRRNADEATPHRVLASFPQGAQKNDSPLQAILATALGLKVIY
jgi:hypothetical protein